LGYHHKRRQDLLRKRKDITGKEFESKRNPPRGGGEAGIIALLLSLYN